MNRRTFIQHTGLLTAAAWAAPAAFASTNATDLPRWKGFNLLDFFAPQPAANAARAGTTEEQLKWIRDWGFNFVRLPLAYPRYLSFDRSKAITPKEVYNIDEAAVAQIDQLVYQATKLGLHVSLNLHRAPGYCINAGFEEPYNLWKDHEAVEAFAFHWNFWAKRYKNLSREALSFDLLNEPTMRDDMNDQHSPSRPVPGAVYKAVASAALQAIKKENKTRLVIADGNSGGNTVVPELAGLDLAQSCRGYYPHQISHYKAPWANKDPAHLPEPKYPGQVGNDYLNRQKLEAYYAPWIALKKSGVGVHCGECGCWNKTPHDVFLAWFGDVLDILSSNGIGFALWEFIGDFGILNSGRADVAYEDWKGYKLDRKLLALLQKF